MVKVGDLLKTASKSIGSLDAGVILSFLLNIERAHLPLKHNMSVDAKISVEYERLVNIRKNGCPTAYITGEKEFYSLPFIVSPAVLIPRPDTEILVEWGIQKARAGFTKVLDLCTGSGCIGIAVGHYVKDTNITLADISLDALSVAEQNATINGVHASLLNLDILQDEILGKYNLILSNPPYIESSQIPSLDEDVCGFEPNIALDGGRDGLSFYPEIIKKAVGVLETGGYLGLEIGHTQSEQVMDLMGQYFCDVETLSDLAGHLRVVVGRRYT